MVLTQSQVQDVRVVVNDAVKTLIADKDFLLTVAKTVAEVVQNNLQKMFDEQNKLLSEMQQRIASLEEQNAQVLVEKNALQDELDDLQQYTRRNSIRILGIPEQMGENPVQVVLNLFKEKLKIETETNKIDRAHRVGKISSKYHRCLIVKFISYHERKKVFDMKKLLKGSGIRIVEDLTKRRVEVLNAAKQQYKNENVWTSDGTIMIKKGTQKIAVRRMADLS